MVNKGEEVEQSLYNKVRNAEYARQKQEQSVRHLQQQLQDAKRKNAIRVKQEISDRNKQEMELQQQLVKEKAELDKVGELGLVDINLFPYIDASAADSFLKT